MDSNRLRHGAAGRLASSRACWSGPQGLSYRLHLRTLAPPQSPAPRRKTASARVRGLTRAGSGKSRRRGSLPCLTAQLLRGGERFSRKRIRCGKGFIAGSGQGGCPRVGRGGPWAVQKPSHPALADDDAFVSIDAGTKPPPAFTAEKGGDKWEQRVMRVLQARLAERVHLTSDGVSLPTLSPSHVRRALSQADG